MERANSGGASEPQTPTPRRWPQRISGWRRGEDERGLLSGARGRVLSSLAGLTAGLLAFHSAVPNSVGHLGSLLETFLPWLGLAVVVLLVLAVLSRSAVALVAVLLPAAVWSHLFGALLLPEDRGAHDITVLQHNVSDENTDPAGTASALIESAPDLVALEELTPSALPDYETAMASDYPHHAVRGTVGLWSKYPLAGARAMDIKPEGIEEDWSRGLQARVRTPWGEVAVYVAHLPSVRIRWNGFDTHRRDESAALLGAAIAAGERDEVILLGDLNSTVDDRGLAPVTSQLTPSGQSFAFSWPRLFPVARIDQIMTRSATVTGIRTLPATASDHMPIAADIELGRHA